MRVFNKLLVILFLGFIFVSINKVTHRKTGLKAMINGISYKYRYLLDTSFLNNKIIEIVSEDSNYRVTEFYLNYNCNGCDFLDKKIKGNSFYFKELGRQRKVEIGETIFFNDIVAIQNDTVAYLKPISILVVRKEDINNPKFKYNYR